MRGIVSASMLVALEDLGFADAFDVVYGCSSGAVNGAYFLAEEVRGTRRPYTTTISRLVNSWMRASSWWAGRR